MTASIRPSAPPKGLALLDPRRAIGRSALSIAVAGLVVAILEPWFGDAVSVLGGWDAGGLVLLALSWATIGRCDPSRTQARAGAEDPGRTAVYGVVTLTSFVSLFAATILARQAHALASGFERSLLVALCLATVALSWALTHTSFTLRYAHLYYREDAEGIGGVDFPGGGRPSYFDFAYFAFTVGMCFQVSDVTVSSAQIRRAVLAQALLSFAYNTVILAFVLNLVFGALG